MPLKALRNVVIRAKAKLHEVPLDRSGHPGTWRLPRSAFQEIFMRRTQHLSTLAPEVRSYARSQRTDETLSFGQEGASA